jgi:hypothetical protein
MKKHIIRLSLVLLLIMGLASNAAAIPINGAIALSGGGQTDNDVDLTVATKFNALGPGIVNTGTGDYSGVPTFLSSPVVTFTPFTFLTVPVVPLWTFDYNGKTYSFDATSMTKNADVHMITFAGLGIAHITGFEDTIGEWSFTAQHLGEPGAFSFSTSAATVPEPLTLILLGSGLLGLAGLRRKLGR